VTGFCVFAGDLCRCANGRRIAGGFER
jgi:hypothetical protein